MVNKTQDQVSKLPSVEKFIREHLNVIELSEVCLKILYNFAYTHLKYLNKNVVLTTNERKVLKLAKDDIWSYVMGRVDADRQAGKDHSVVKERFISLLSIVSFEPI